LLFLFSNRTSEIRGMKKGLSLEKEQIGFWEAKKTK
jgi:hypothetical protein